MAQANSKSWKKIFDDYNIHQHPFGRKPFYISADQIKVCEVSLKKRINDLFIFWLVGSHKHPS